MGVFFATYKKVPPDMPLNDAACKNAQIKEKQYKLADSNGLFLLVKPNGRKYWRLKYRIHQKEKMLALGVYPEVTLKDARHKRDEARRQLAEGIDPAEIKKTAKRQARLNHENTMPYAIYRMGYHSRLTIHGLRGTVSTILNEHGFHPDVIERQLAHSEANAVRAAYNHAGYLPERKQMMQWWADYIDAAASGKTPDASNVIQAQFIR